MAGLVIVIVGIICGVAASYIDPVLGIVAIGLFGLIGLIVMWQELS